MGLSDTQCSNHQPLKPELDPPAGIKHSLPDLYLIGQRGTTSFTFTRSNHDRFTSTRSPVCPQHAHALVQGFAILLTVYATQDSLIQASLIHCLLLNRQSPRQRLRFLEIRDSPRPVRALRSGSAAAWARAWAGGGGGGRFRLIFTSITADRPQHGVGTAVIWRSH